MKYNYLSKYDFEKKCPCHFQLTAYAESLFPPSAYVCFLDGRQVGSDMYTARFDVLLKTGNTCELEVSCKMNPDHSYSYEILKRTDDHQTTDI